MALGAANPVSAAGHTVASFKKLFFDREKVLKAAERGQRKALSKFGAFVRRRARSSMRKRKKGHSQPGQPPFVKKGQLKKLLFFGYDPLTKSVVVGPAAIGKSPVPKTHEFGGKLTVRRKVSGKRVGVMVRYEPRPFMAPALAAELPKFADQFRGSITE